MKLSANTWKISCLGAKSRRDSLSFISFELTQCKATSGKQENQNKYNLIGIGNRSDSLEESVKPILSPIPWESADSDSDPMESVVHYFLD